MMAAVMCHRHRYDILSRGRYSMRIGIDDDNVLMIYSMMFATMAVRA